MNLVKIQSINLWDEEWEVGGYNSANGNKLADSTRIRCKNKIEIKPNTQYYNQGAPDGTVYYYDINENYLLYSGSALPQKVFTSPSNAYYMTFQVTASYGTTYNNDIQICLNSCTDKTTYHPHWVLGLDGQGKAIGYDGNFFTGDYSQFTNTGGTGILYSYFKLPNTNKGYCFSITAKNDVTSSIQVLGFTGNGGDANNGYTWCVRTGVPYVKGETYTIGNFLSSSTKAQYVSMHPKGSGALDWIMQNFDVELIEM